MKVSKKTVLFSLAALLCVLSLGACKGPVGSTSSKTSSESITDTRAYPYAFTDLAGAKITLSKKVQMVYIYGSVQPLLGLYRYYRGNSDGLLGVPAASQAIIKSSVFAEIWPDIIAGTPHTDEITVEEILAQNPDVVFMTGSASGSNYDALKNAGLTVISFPTAGSGDDSDTFYTIASWLRQMGEVFGDSKAAEDLIAYNAATLREIDAKLANVAAVDKPSVMIIFQLSDRNLTVAGGGHYSDFWIMHSGGVNAASELDKIQPVGIEQVMAWNPDIIYITTFSPAMPEDLYNNTIAGFDWSQVKAVQNKQVYKIPLGSYRWYAPSCEGSLMLQWMAAINHPDIFNNVNIEAKVVEFFEKFYGVTPTDEQVKVLLNPSDPSLMTH